MLHTHIAFLRKFYISGLASASFLAVFIMLAIFPVANSFSGVQAASVVSETSLTMTTSDIALALSVDSATGTFSESDSADLSVTTNNYSGYTLSIRAANDDENYSKLVNGESVLNSISSASDESGFNNGNWGFKPSKLNSASNDDFLPAPTYEGTTLDTTAVANNEANTYDISIGAKANYGLAAGKYSNTFIITAIANPVAYSISYNSNTLDQSVANMPTTQVGDTTDTSVTLANNVPTRTGYTFTDWCLGTVTNNNGIDTCSGTTYSPSDTYDTNQTQQNIIELLAMWEQTVVSGYTINFDANNGTGTMNPQVIPYGESDNLDANTFIRTDYVFDGWNTANDGNGTDYADEASFTAPADDTGGSSITLYAKWATPVYDTIVFNGNGSDGGTAMANQQVMQGTTADLDPNTYTKSNYYFDGWNTDANNLGEGIGDGDKYTAVKTGAPKTVNLYAQWGTNRTCVENCSGGGNPSYESGITIARAYELAYTQHQIGMYEETVNGNGIYQQVDSWNPVNPEQYKGFDVRFAMQDINLTYNDGTSTKTVCELVTVIGDQYRALDVRDNRLYWISKLADGRCWMTQNLDLDLDSTKTYTHADTDLGWTTLNANASWTPSASTVSLGDISSGVPNNWTQNDTGPVSGDAGNTYVSASGQAFTDGTFHSSLSDCIANSATHSKTDCEHYHSGNYYNYGAAVAENNMNTSAYHSRLTQVENSICPAGWRLPASAPTNYTLNGSFANNLFEFSYLFDSYNVTDGPFWLDADADWYDWDAGGIQLHATPLYFNMTGAIGDYGYGSVAINWIGSTGDYWSSTLGGDRNNSNQQLSGYTAFILVTDESEGITPTKAQQPFDMGYPIRCIAR